MADTYHVFGIEIGKDNMTGYGLSDATSPSNPVRIAYEHWDAHFWPIWDPKYHPGRIKPHSTYDQIVVLYGIRGLADYWNSSEPGNRRDLQRRRNALDGSPERNPAVPHREDEPEGTGRDY